MITPRDFWDMRSETYDQNSGQEYADAYRKTINNTLRYLKPKDTVLEFACGTGITTTAIAPHVARVRAIDISNKMVEVAQAKVKKLGLTNVELSQTDLFDPCLQEGSFDVLTAFNVLLYVEDRSQVLKRIHSLLKPNGIFLSATDCLGEKITKVGLKKFVKSHTGSMPYVAFETMDHLEQEVAQEGFLVLEREDVHRAAPPNLYLAARRL